jgi:YfiR/HmsC-like
MSPKRRESGPLRAACLLVQFCLIVFVTLLSPVAALQNRVQASVSVEYQVKAAFLFNFAKFVEWPPDAFQNEKAPINLCVFRHDPFGGALDEIMKGKIVNNREVIARRTDELTELKSCQLVFVSNTEDKRLSEVLDGLKGKSALVVGESDGFAERGGGIQFFQEDNKVRFAINVNAIQRARLTVNSGLLALARIVHDSGQPKGN